jgi:hypothetical protein
MPRAHFSAAERRAIVRGFNAELSRRLMVVCGERSYAELAELTGFNHETVRRYVLGLVTPSPLFLAVLCGSFGYSPNWLLLGRGSPRAGRGRRRGA